MNRKLTTNQVAIMAGVDPSAIRYHIRHDNIKAKIEDYPVSEGGPQYRFEKEEVLRFLQQKHSTKLQKTKELHQNVNQLKQSIRKLKEELK